MKTSLPAPPVKVSLPVPPFKLSFPASPFNISLSASPLSLSFPLPPNNVSLPSPPLIVSSDFPPFIELLVVLPVILRLRETSVALTFVTPFDHSLFRSIVFPVNLAEAVKTLFLMERPSGIDSSVKISSLYPTPVILTLFGSTILADTDTTLSLMLIPSMTPFLADTPVFKPLTVTSVFPPLALL